MTCSFMDNVADKRVKIDIGVGNPVFGVDLEGTFVPTKSDSNILFTIVQLNIFT